MANEALDSAERLTLFFGHWSPKVVTRLNHCAIKVINLEGGFVWHAHQDTDGQFLVIAGELMIQLREGNVTLIPEQFFIGPKGVEHCPIAGGEVHALLIEPAGVLNTGEAGGSMTAAYDDTLAQPPPPADGVTTPAGQDPDRAHGRRARLPWVPQPAAPQAGHRRTKLTRARAGRVLFHASAHREARPLVVLAHREDYP